MIHEAKREMRTWRERLEAIIDIWDDGNLYPDDRCYVPGALRAEIDEARRALAARLREGERDVRIAELEQKLAEAKARALELAAEADHIKQVEFPKRAENIANHWRAIVRDWKANAADAESRLSAVEAALRELVRTNSIRESSEFLDMTPAERSDVLIQDERAFEAARAIAEKERKNVE